MKKDNVKLGLTLSFCLNGIFLSCFFHFDADQGNDDRCERQHCHYGKRPAPSADGGKPSEACGSGKITQMNTKVQNTNELCDVFSVHATNGVKAQKERQRRRHGNGVDDEKEYDHRNGSRAEALNGDEADHGKRKGDHGRPKQIFRFTSHTARKQRAANLKHGHECCDCCGKRNAQFEVFVQKRGNPEGNAFP